MYQNLQLLVRINNLFDSSYFCGNHLGTHLMGSHYCNTLVERIAPSPGGDGDGNEHVGESSVKTLSPTPGAPARNDDPSPILDDDTTDYEPTRMVL